jgi:UDPglucose 6-dehydrogenase
MRIGVIGFGSIGSVLARGFDQLGHDVVANDTNKERVYNSRFDYRSHDWIQDNCQLAVFALPTPTTENGGDASTVDHVLGQYHNADATLCLKSTMPPGSTSTLCEKHDLDVVYCPEFLRDRSTVEDFFDVDRLVLAGPERECDVVAEAFDHPQMQIGEVIETPDYLTAELGKEAHNAFFATKVSFANQMRVIAEAGGADPEGVMDIVTADSRNTTSHLDPMLGAYGGKCLPKDTEALAMYGGQQGVRVPLLSGTMQTNGIARQQFENAEIEGDWPDIKTSASD